MARLPKGWTVELQGLAASVIFRGPHGSQLLWTDGEWFVTSGRHAMPAPGVPMARTMREARAVGSAFLMATSEG